MFRADGKTTDQLEKALERAAAKQLGVETDSSSAGEGVQAVIRSQSVPARAKDDPASACCVLEGSRGSREGDRTPKAIVGRKSCEPRPLRLIVYPEASVAPS